MLNDEILGRPEIMAFMHIRTRFAPSPTGFIHLGNLRSALYPWAFARHNKGDFILRIEDTDVERSTQEAVDVIIEGMAWLGLDLDEGPIIEQDITRVSHSHSIEDFIMKGKDLERIVLSRAIKLHAERKTMVYSNKTVIFS